MLQPPVQEAWRSPGGRLAVPGVQGVKGVQGVQGMNSVQGVRGVQGVQDDEKWIIQENSCFHAAMQKRILKPADIQVFHNI